MTRYRNSFFDPNQQADHGPEFFETDTLPTEHCGLLIYRRQANCFDIVDDGVCVGMYAGIDGAKDAIETRFGRATPLRDLAIASPQPETQSSLFLRSLKCRTIRRPHRSKN